MREGSEVLLELMRRAAGRDEVDLVEIEAPVGGACHAKMTAMNGIEGAAKKGDGARMMFCGSAVSLRGGQYASQAVSKKDFLMNTGLRQQARRNRQL